MFALPTLLMYFIVHWNKKAQKTEISNQKRLSSTEKFVLLWFSFDVAGKVRTWLDAGLAIFRKTLDRKD